METTVFANGPEVKGIPEFADDRHKTWCIHCGATLANVESNRDHVPSKSILDRPLPENLPTVRICRTCNSSFSTDEEYFVAILGTILQGHLDPEPQIVKRAKRILKSNYRLQNQIEDQLTIEPTKDGGVSISLVPEPVSLQNVVVKNARGHALFEHGQPAFGKPKNVVVMPLQELSPDARELFETIDYGQGWPEIGSRLMNRLITGEDMRPDGWVIVQPNIYRFAVVENTQFVVRTVIHEYLATEVIWQS